MKNTPNIVLCAIIVLVTLEYLESAALDAASKESANDDPASSDLFAMVLLICFGEVEYDNNEESPAMDLLRNASWIEGSFGGFGWECTDSLAFQKIINEIGINMIDNGDIKIMVICNFCDNETKLKVLWMDRFMVRDIK